MLALTAAPRGAQGDIGPKLDVLDRFIASEMTFCDPTKHSRRKTHALVLAEGACNQVRWHDPCAGGCACDACASSSVP